MILSRNKDKFDNLVAQYQEWERQKDQRQQMLFEEMREIASVEEIAQALELNRKTLYNRHQWTK